MVIQFLCPNGHRIHCGDDRAGKAAKCPQCGVKFRVPAPANTRPPTAPPDQTSGELHEPLLVKSEAAPPEGTEPLFEFLCPAGHHLRSPVSLQRQPGQCPACGSQFYIPSADEPEEPLRLEPSEGSSIRVHEGRPEGVSDAPSDSQVPLAMRMAVTDHSMSGPALHPMAVLFAQLWAQKTSGAVFELCLNDGQTLIPDHYSRRSSQGDYGLFATRQPNGSFTVTAIAWASVEQVILRGLTRLPDGFQE